MPRVRGLWIHHPRLSRQETINKNLEELRREALLVGLRRRLRDVKQGRDGLLYLLTDEADAVMLRIEPAE